MKNNHITHPTIIILQTMALTIIGSGPGSINVLVNKGSAQGILFELINKNIKRHMYPAYDSWYERCYGHGFAELDNSENPSIMDLLCTDKIIFHKNIKVPKNPDMFGYVSQIVNAQSFDSQATGAEDSNGLEIQSRAGTKLRGKSLSSNYAYGNSLS